MEETVCIFCKIVAGQLPSNKVYEDESILAFLDISPVSEGHVVVVTKKHYEQVWDAEDQDYQKLMHVSKLVAQRLQETYGSHRIALVVEGLEVDHAHTKVFSITDNDMLATLQTTDAPMAAAEDLFIDTMK